MAASISCMVQISVVAGISSDGAETTDEAVKVKYIAIAYGGE